MGTVTKRRASCVSRSVRRAQVLLLAFIPLTIIGLVAPVAVLATPVPPAGPVPGPLQPTLGVAGDVRSCGVDLQDAPDTAIGVHRSSTGLEAYVVAGVKTFRCTGQSMGRLALDPVPAVFSPSGAGFDRSYAGIAGVVNPTSNPAFRIGFYHAENHCPTVTGRSANAVGIAFSSDTGRTWTGRRQLVGPPNPRPACEGFTGVGQPGAIVTGGYVVVFFTDWTPGRPDAVGLVRAPVAQAADPAAYRKFNGSSWTAALGGQGSPVISRPSEIDGYAAAAHVTYNTKLGTYLAVFETNRGFAVAASRDLLNWGPGKVVFWFAQPQQPIVAGALWQSYPTLLSADIGDPQVTGASNYLYFGQGRRGSQAHHMVRTWLAFGPPSLPSGFAIPAAGTFTPSPAQSPFAWACGADVKISGPSGTQVLYDSRGDTGVIVALSSGNEATTVHAPYGASCRPAYPAGRDALVTAMVNEMRSSGCSSRSAAVRVVVLDSAGRVLSDQWR